MQCWDSLASSKYVECIVVLASELCAVSVLCVVYCRFVQMLNHLY